MALTESKDSHNPRSSPQSFDSPPPAKSSKSPLPTVQAFERGTATVENVIEVLKVAGGVIVRRFLTLEVIGRIMDDIIPYLDADKPWDGDFFPAQTQRAFGLIGKSPTFAESMVGDPFWLYITDTLLASHVKYWVGDETEQSTSLPQVHNTIAFRIGPGARAQALHRDDPPHHPQHGAVAEHALGRDCGVGLFVAANVTTKANGATRFIPGSHLWDYQEGPPAEDQTVYAELDPGDAFIMLSGCFHGGSANLTKDEYRTVLSTFSTRGWLRQEENQYLANSIQSIQALPSAIQERMGYGLSWPFLGWVDLRSPMALLHPSYGQKRKDLY